MFSQEAFNQFIKDYKVIKTFEKPITLKSGRQSKWYVNWRTVTNDVYGCDQLTTFINHFIKQHKLDPDTLYGVPEGATKLGVLSQYKWAKQSPKFSRNSHTLAMGRSKPKDHGDSQDKYFIGKPEGSIIILEDVTTTGGSLLTTIESLQKADCTILAAISLTNRMEIRDDGLTVPQAVEAKGVPYLAMSELSETFQTN